MDGWISLLRYSRKAARPSIGTNRAQFHFPPSGPSCGTGLIFHPGGSFRLFMEIVCKSKSKCNVDTAKKKLAFQSQRLHIMHTVCSAGPSTFMMFHFDSLTYIRLCTDAQHCGSQMLCRVMFLIHFWLKPDYTHCYI